MRGDFFTRLLQLRDGLLAGLVEIAVVGLDTLVALAFFAAEDHLHAGVRPLTKRGVQLGGEVALLRGALTLQFGDRGVHLVNLLVQLGQGGLGFAQLAGGGGDGFFLAL